MPDSKKTVVTQTPPAPAPASTIGAARRVAILSQKTGTQTRSTTIDGTKIFTILPLQDGEVKLHQDNHGDFFFPNSNPITITFKGAWSVDPPPPPPPPPGTLAFNLTPDQSSTAFQRWLQIIATQDHDDVSATDCAFAFKYTGNQTYRTQAIGLAEAIATAAEAAIAAGQNPDFADDSYLYSGGLVQELAIVYAWCNPSDSQKARYKALIEQTVFNIWNPDQAKWGGRLATWSGWSINDPMNNYYYSFMRATIMAAVAVNSTAIVKDGKTAMQYLQTDRWPLLTAAMATIAGGGSLEGTGYGTSHMTLFEIMKWWKDSTGFDVTDAHMVNSIHIWNHHVIPEGGHFWPYGSQSRVSDAPVFDYHLKLVELAALQTTDAAAINSAHSFFSRILVPGTTQPYTTMQSRFMAFWDLIPRTGTVTPPALTFAAPEVGAFMGRTSWNTNATWCGVLMGNYSQSHAHGEQGSVSFAGPGGVKGWLTVTNNMNSHSGIEGEAGGSSRDNNVVVFYKGGTEQRQKMNHTVQVSGYTTQPNGDFTITGDLTSFYDSSAGVNLWRRAVQFASGVVTVSDVVTLASGTTAKQQWNVPVAPSINGNVITAGHLRITAPVGSVITTVQMSTLDSDYLPGCYRVDIAFNTTCITKLEVI